MTRVLVTGATGFLGGALLARLIADGCFVPRAASRQEKWSWPERVEMVHVGGLAADTEWGCAVSGSNVVIHTSARVHIMKDHARDPLSEYRHVNVEGSLNLARQAAAAGVSRFVFISSIKVNGEITTLNRPFTAGDIPAPVDPYGISKRETEEGLYRIGMETGMEIVIIRPPLIYGPGVKANFRTMMHWLYRGVPLPLGNVQNRRSLVALNNLVDLIVTCIEHPSAANQTFLVSDGEDLSTTELLNRLGKALGKPARLIPIPCAVLKLGAVMLGRRDVAKRLLDSLLIDIGKNKDLLGWQPPITVNQGLEEVARWYIDQVRGV